MTQDGSLDYTKTMSAEEFRSVTVSITRSRDGVIPRAAASPSDGRARLEIERTDSEHELLRTRLAAFASASPALPFTVATTAATRYVDLVADDRSPAAACRRDGLAHSSAFSFARTFE